MLRRLFEGRSRRRDAAAARVPEGVRLYAVGDIHGHLDLLEQINANDQARGPAELLDALAGDMRALKGFCRMGGRETILSYGLNAAAYDRMDYDEFAAALPGLIPAEHRAFLEGFEAMIAIGDYAFVHAGIDPAKPLDGQSLADLRWIREPFLGHTAAFEKRIVHGHTPVDTVDWRHSRIGIDTDTYMTDKLTALGLKGAATWIVDTWAVKPGTRSRSHPTPSSGTVTAAAPDRSGGGSF